LIHHEIHHHLYDHQIGYQKYPHLGDLVIDQTITNHQVIHSLQHMDSSSQVWSDAHVLTLSAFRAMEYLEAGQVAEALKEMEQAVVSHSWNAIDLDGFLTVLADVLHQAGHTLDAMTCLLMSWH